MKQYFVYIITCSDDSYYVGITNNIKRRFIEHSSGKNPNSYTAKRLPLKLSYFEVYNYPLNAIKREKQLKGWSRIKKEALMSKEYKSLKFFAKQKNWSKRHSRT